MRTNQVLLLLSALAMAGCLSTSPSDDLAGPYPNSGEPDASSKLELPPKEKAKACLAAGQLLEKQSSWREAAFEYETARAADSSLGKFLCRRLAVIYDRLGDFPKAAAEYDKALALQPKDADLLNDAGYSRYRANECAAAERYLRRSVEINPGLKRAWVNLGMTLAQLDRAAEALDAFTHVVPEPEARCNLAFAYSLRGKRREAVEEYRRALELNPDLELARGAMAKLEHSTGALEPMPAQATGDSSGFASQRLN